MKNQRVSSRRKQDQSGFALLVIFLVAAGIMISLYMEIPRVAFESQRNREEMLIERGEQYQRAIEVFFRKNKRYPQKIEDLESFNNMRFLRKRYVDPLTGKDEWRMVHMGPAGQLADSLVEKPGQMPGQQVAGVNGLNTTPAAQPANGTPANPNDPAEQSLAKNRIRPSDRAPGMPGAGGGAFDPNNPNAQFQQQQPVDANGNPITDPAQLAAINNGTFNGSGGFNPNLPNGQQSQFPNFPGQAPTLPNQAGVNPIGVQPGAPSQNVFYQNGQQPFSPGNQLQGQIGAQNGLNPAQAGFGQNPALNAINNQLRNQNQFAGGYNASGYGSTPGDPNYQLPPGATKLADGRVKMPDGTIINKDGSMVQPNGVTTPPPPPANGQGTSGIGTSGFGTAAQTSQLSTNQTMGGGGIAGVASNQTGVGIKTYNDRKKYKEWEFVYDYRKPKGKPATPTPAGTNPNPASTNLLNSRTPTGPNQ